MLLSLTLIFAKKNNKINIFRYTSNLKVTNNNIKEIIILGRKRWKIENEGFYMQKHKIFNISHMNSKNDNAMKCHYFFYPICSYHQTIN